MAEKEKLSEGDGIQCAIDRFEGDTAVLLTEAKEKIYIPKKYLPTQAKEGGIVAIKVNSLEDIEKQRAQTAKDILNELFGEHPQ
ncbi:DUF3006 domain-containing protein [Patescibacteria group bacterium]|nr:MAG: DUF3006 domain-containing protein [Patescibacteria group bacterium]